MDKNISGVSRGWLSLKKMHTKYIKFVEIYYADFNYKVVKVVVDFKISGQRWTQS